MINPRTTEDQTPPLTPDNCKSTHGLKGMLLGTVYDQSTGQYICPCGRQFISTLQPNFVDTIRTYQSAHESTLTD